MGRERIYSNGSCHFHGLSSWSESDVSVWCPVSSGWHRGSQCSLVPQVVILLQVAPEVWSVFLSIVFFLFSSCFWRARKEMGQVTPPRLLILSFLSTIPLRRICSSAQSGAANCAAFSIYYPVVFPYIDPNKAKILEYTLFFLPIFPLPTDSTPTDSFCVYHFGT